MVEVERLVERHAPGRLHRARVGPPEVQAGAARDADIVIGPRMRVGWLGDLRAPHSTYGTSRTPSDTAVADGTEVIVVPTVGVRALVQCNALSARHDAVVAECDGAIHLRDR